MFCFDQDTGEISWDYMISSVPVYQYQDYNMNLRIFLELLCIVLLVINCLSEAAGLFLVLFVGSPFNLSHQNGVCRYCRCSETL